MFDYPDFYNKISENIKFNDTKIKLLNLQIKFMPYIFVVLYFVYILLLYRDYKIDSTQFKKLSTGIIVPSVSFVILTKIRMIINAKRPYEIYDINPLIKNEKKGQSMPSRHIFSAALISMGYVTISPYIAIILLILTLIMAKDRVVAGIHFPRDVIVGFIIGAICSIPLIYRF